MTSRPRPRLVGTTLKSASQVAEMQAAQIDPL